MELIPIVASWHRRTPTRPHIPWPGDRALVGLGLVILLVVASCSPASSPAGGTAATASEAPSLAVSLSSTPTAAPSATPISAPRTIPEAVPAALTPGVIHQCFLADAFASHFSSDGKDYQVQVGLGTQDCPPGGVGIVVQGNVEVAGPGSGAIDPGSVMLIVAGGGVAYETPQGEVQVTVQLSRPSGRSLVVFFTAVKIDKVTLLGNGASVDLQKQ